MDTTYTVISRCFSTGEETVFHIKLTTNVNFMSQTIPRPGHAFRRQDRRQDLTGT